MAKYHNPKTGKTIEASNAKLAEEKGVYKTTKKKEETDG